MTDFGTHGIIDLDPNDGTRLKAQFADSRLWSRGGHVDLRPSAFAAYRDDRVVVRSGAVDTALSLGEVVNG